MKKTLALFLILSLIFSLGGGLAMAESPADFAGSYTLVGMTDEDGSDMSEQLALLTAFGMSATLTIAADGSGSLDLFDETTDISFDYDAMVVDMDGDPAPFAWEDGSLVISDPESDMTLTFRRDDPSAEKDVNSFSLTAPVAVDEDPGLPGSYTLIGMTDENGEDLSEQLALLSSFGMSATLTVNEDGSGVMNLFGETMELSFDFDAQTAAAEDEAMPYTYENGVITFADEDGTSLVFAREGAAAEAPAAPAVPADRAYTLGETVLVDNDDLTFTVTGVKESDYEVSFSVFCENKTNAALYFCWYNAAVNGCMLDPYWSVDVPAGKKLNSTVSFSKDDLDLFDLQPIDELWFNLFVYDDESWDTVLDESFTIYPTGLSADTVVYPDRWEFEDEQIVIDNDYATFIINMTDPDGYYGYTLLVYAENKTDRPLNFSWENVSVNDYMIDPYWSCFVAPHAHAYEEISFYASDFEDNGIEDVEEIEFELDVYDYDTWDYYLEDTFTYEP